MKRISKTLIASAAVAGLIAGAIAAPAMAEQKGNPLKGEGSNMKIIANVPYSSGSDMEFATIKGRTYQVWIFKTAIAAVRPGRLDIGPAEINPVVRVARPGDPKRPSLSSGPQLASNQAVEPAEDIPAAEARVVGVGRDGRGAIAAGFGGFAPGRFSPRRRRARQPRRRGDREAAMIPLIAGVFVASLIGSLHCAGMCGAMRVPVACLTASRVAKRS